MENEKSKYNRKSFEVKYIEKFTYWLINKPIFEMAYYRKDAVNKIRSLSGTILIHILKIKYIKNNENIDHWISEIKDYFRKIDEIEIKPFNRKFTSNEYLEFLLIEPYCTSESSAKKDKIEFIEPHIKKIINYINIDYNTNIKYEEINFENIILFFKKICLSLEKNENIIDVINEEFEK